MKIAVLVKQVPDTETKIKIKPDACGIEEEGVKFVMNPYDEFAVEEAIKIKDKFLGSETVVLSLGPERSLETIRTALAMGIDKGIHIQNDLPAIDSYVTAIALSKAIGEPPFDLILCGKQAIDADNSQVVGMVGDMLDIPHVMIVEKIDFSSDAKSMLVSRRVSGGTKEIYDVALPAILGCEKGLNTPRYASLPGIMKAKSKPILKLKVSELIGEAKPLVSFVNYQLPPERAAGKKIGGEPLEQARELVRLLREEAKVI